MSSLPERFAEKFGRWPTEFDPDYLEMLRMSKYRILDRPDVKTAKCSNCGATKVDGRKYIDFGLQIDWYGAVFLCSRCVYDIAKEMGLFNAIEQQLLEANNSLIKIQNTQIDGKLLHDQFLHTFRGVQEYFASINLTRDDLVVDSSPVLEPDSSDNESRSTEVKSAIDGPKQRIAKSTSSSGSKNLPSLAELLSKAES